MTYGFAGYIGIAREATYGSPIAPTDFIEAMSEDFSMVVERFETRNIINGFYEPDDKDGVQRHEGTLVFAGFPHAIGWLMYGAFGQTSVTAVGSGFTTIFNVLQSDVSSTNPLPALAFDIFRDVTTAQRYGGGQVTGLSFSIAPNQDLRVSASILAKNITQVATVAVTYPTSPVDPFTFDQASLSIGGVANALVETFNIEISNNLEGIPALDNTATISRVRRSGPPTVRVSGTVDFLNIDEFEKFRVQTEQAFFLNFFMAESFSLLFHMPRVVYTSFPLGMPGRERLSVSFEGKARYDTTSGYALSANMTSINSY